MMAAETQVLMKGKFPERMGGGTEGGGFLKEVKTGCWFYRNNNIQNRLVHCVPRLLKQKMFLIGTFNKDFF